MQGRAEVNLLSTDAVVTEALLLEILEDGKPGAPTHVYNGTLRLDQKARSLFTRSVIITVPSNHTRSWCISDYKYLSYYNRMKSRTHIV